MNRFNDEQGYQSRIFEKKHRVWDWASDGHNFKVCILASTLQCQEYSSADPLRLFTENHAFEHLWFQKISQISSNFGYVDDTTIL